MNEIDLFVILRRLFKAILSLGQVGHLTYKHEIPNLREKREGGNLKKDLPVNFLG